MQAVNIRCTIVKLQGGGLFVYAPVAPTKEFLAMVRELEGEHGKIKFIIEPTYGIEHKVFAGPFSRRFPDAKVFVPPGNLTIDSHVSTQSRMGCPSQLGPRRMLVSNV